MTITFARSLLLLLALAAGITGAKTRQAAAQTNASQGLSCPQPYYESGFDRVGLRGSKSALKDAVQRGEAIRLGWAIDFDGDGTADLSHWSPASFLTVWEGEVFAQVTAIHRQRPRRGEATVALPADYEEWRGLLGTDGRLQGAFSSGRAASEVAVRIVWCPARVPAPAWVPLFTNGTGGEVLSGSKKALFAAIRAGLPLQIGWGLARDGDGARKSVEHVITPDFVTIVDGEHVVAQLPEHIAQRSYWSAEDAFFDDGAVLWRGVMATTGSFDAIWVHRGTGEVVRRSPQRAALTWFAPAAPDPSTHRPLAIPNGVIRDKAREGERVTP